MDTRSSPSLQSSPQSLFSCRIVDIDSYVTSPISDLDLTYSIFTGHSIKRVPIIRIFGSTPAGQKSCVHVHGAFPYLYIPSPVDNPTESYLQLLRRSIDHALQIATGSKEENYVFNILTVKGIPFYGYNANEKLFLKIFLYVPSHIKKLADLLLSGAVMNISLQPHESHIPFVLQFMIDYSLYGMNFIHTSDLRFRINNEDSFSDQQETLSCSPLLHDSPLSSCCSNSSHSLINPSQKIWNIKTISNSLLLYQSRISSCELEVDIKVDNIMNREEVNMISSGYPGLVALWEEEQMRRETLGLDNPLSQPSTPDRVCSLLHPAELRHKSELCDIINSLPSATPLISPTLEGYSLSCDPDIVGSSQSHDLTQPTRTVHDSEILVDEHKLDQSIRLKKKLSSVSLNSSDIELVNLLADLVQPSQTSEGSASLLLSDSAVKPVRKTSSSNDSCIDLFDESKMETLDMQLDSIAHDKTREEGGATSESGNMADDSFVTDSQFPLSQFLSSMQRDSTSLSYRDKKRLVQLCLSSDDNEKEEERASESSDSSDDEESILMSQPFDKLSIEDEDEFIPQLDGHDSKKTLGTTRRKLKTPLRSRKYSNIVLISTPVDDIGLIPEPDTRPIPGPDTRPIPGPDTRPIPGPDTRPIPGPDTRPIPGPNTRPIPDPDTRPIPGPDMRPIPGPNTRPIPGLDTRPIPGPDTRFIPKPTRLSLSLRRKRKAPVDVSEPPKQATPMADTPTQSLIDRALHNSLYPKVRKLSRKDSEKYFSKMKQCKRGKDSKPLSSASKRRRYTRSTCHLDNIDSADEEEKMLYKAITESLKSFEVEQSDREIVIIEDEVNNKVIKDIADYDDDDDDEKTTPHNKSGIESETESLNDFCLALSASESDTDTERYGSQPERHGSQTEQHESQPEQHGSQPEFTKSHTQIHWNIDDTVTTHATEIPITATSPPLEGTPVPITATSPPLEGTPVPITATSPPLEGTPVSITGTSPPLEGTPVSMCVITPQCSPPTLEYVMKTSVDIYGLPSVRYTKPFYSKPADVQLPQDVGGQTLYVPSLMPYELSEFDPPLMYDTPKRSWCSLEHWRTVIAVAEEPRNERKLSLPPSCHKERKNMIYTAENHQSDVKIRSQFWPKGSCIITPVKRPPSYSDIKNWIMSQADHLQTPSAEISNIEGPSLDNTFGFKFSPTAVQDPTANLEIQFITTMSIELHIRTRGGLKPDPEWDPVLVVFYYIHKDWRGQDQLLGAIAIDLSCNNITTPTKMKSPKKSTPTKSTPQKSTPKKFKGSPAKILMGDSSKKRPDDIEDIANFIDSDTEHRYLEHCGISTDINITYVSNETELLTELSQLVTTHDPDILIGYETQSSSWGYLNARALELGFDLIGRISRIPSTRAAPPTRGFSRTSAAEIHIHGRVVLDIWRSMRHEVSLTSYTFESIAFHVLHNRVPHFDYQSLTDWYEHFNRHYRYRVIEYYVMRCYGNYQLLEKLNLIGRTSELARLYGIEFYNVLARGSQYRVESMMLRLAKQSNYIAVSPSVQQRARMAAPECLQLIMEPESKFYSDPVLVLDFQSLYPSVIIAYNYCFSTCLGRVKNLANNDMYTFGTCSLSIPAHQLKDLENDVTISPNGIVFVKPNVRRGILPRMLEDILNTRIMVKQSMKLHKNNKVLQRLLDARQLGLKLIANVTYGYTAASYSGRMPCVEIADSIVRKGRETLERAIQLVHSTPKWRAKVVYGDTDSLFVLLKGVSKEEAFKIGHEICSAVTADNPKPVKLKFEKVYLPCILETKKRYVGFMYESLDQTEPVFDAKGIETVRRDVCPAVSKILEKSLRMLFTSRDVSLVKSYIQRQCTKIMEDRVSVQDFIIAKEYRGRHGYRPGACVPALELAKQATAIDKMDEPLVSERVPYVVVYGSPGLPLIQLIRKPETLLSDPSLRLNGAYYITKQILPALDRALSILGIDVFKWYNELPKVHRIQSVAKGLNRKGTIGQYFSSLHCPLCDKVSADEICPDCSKNPQVVAISLSSRIHSARTNHADLCQLCQNCCGEGSEEYYMECCSLDCPVMYSRQTSLKKLKMAHSYQKSLDKFLAKY